VDAFDVCGDLVNFKIYRFSFKLSKGLIGRVCMYVFIEVSVRAYMSICVCTLIKEITRGSKWGSTNRSANNPISNRLLVGFF
jgi:hypothetical protein